MNVFNNPVVWVVHYMSIYGGICVLILIKACASIHAPIHLSAVAMLWFNMLTNKRGEILKKHC